MKALAVAGLAVAALAVAAFGGCANTQVPTLEPGTPSSPTSGSQSGALLYVSDTLTDDVYVYSYPELQLTQTLTGLKSPQGLCVDASGNVWVIHGNREIVEYAHGGTVPIATVRGILGQQPLSCAVNPANGDLAVTSEAGDDPGGLQIFKAARGKPTFYTDQKMFAPYAVTFDHQGNAFVDGFTIGARFAYAELPKGSTKFVNIVLVGATFKRPGDVQYADGAVAVGDNRSPPVVYQTSGATVTGSTPLRGACHAPRFFIKRARVVVASFCKKRVAILIYSYPAGGSPIKKLAGLSFVAGVAISD